jgi:hypothetical protein
VLDGERLEVASLEAFEQAKIEVLDGERLEAASLEVSK